MNIHSHPYTDSDGSFGHCAFVIPGATDNRCGRSRWSSVHIAFDRERLAINCYDDNGDRLHQTDCKLTDAECRENRGPVGETWIIGEGRRIR